MMAQIENAVLLAQTGDNGALLELLEACRPKLQRYASRECASEDAEEAVQDALWLLYRKVGALKIIGAFSAWLFQIVRRECLRRARNRSRLVQLGECSLSARAQSMGSDQDLRIDIGRAIAALPQAYREVLVLRDIGGYSSEEASERLGIPVAAAKSRLHRARQMVRSQLQTRVYAAERGLPV